MSTENPTLTVYFDGLCRLCSREIQHYRKMRGSGQIRFVDITSADFEAEREQLDPRAVHRHLHARDAEGRLHIGVDAFVQIWRRLPALAFLASLAQRQPVHKSLRALYAIFVRIRPLLPRKSCHDSPFCELPAEH